MLKSILMKTRFYKPEQESIDSYFTLIERFCTENVVNAFLKGLHKISLDKFHKFLIII